MENQHRDVRRISRTGGSRKSIFHAYSSGLRNLWQNSWIFLVVLALPFLLAYWLSPISAVPITDIQEVPLKGPMAINSELSAGKRTPMFAPESIVEDADRNLYVGLRDGRICKIYPNVFGVIGEGKIEDLTNGTLDTISTTTDVSHGIPLGLRLHSNTLFVMDAIYGLYALDLTTLEVKVLVKPTDALPALKFPNDLDITANGRIIYFTDSSHRNSIARLTNEVFEGSCTGRLFSYHVLAKELTTVASNLCFANGVQLTSDERQVIVSETSRYRVSWIDIESGRKKTVVHLPAMPDNVRRNKQGSYWIGASGKHSRLIQFLFDYPILRQFIVGVLPRFVLMAFANKKHNMLFEVNDLGEIFRTKHDPEGNLTYALSQGTELSDGRIALGSYAAPFLAFSESVDCH